MQFALTLVAIVATVIVVARLSAPLGVPAPLALLAVGIAASFVPGIPEIELSPEVVLLGLLPPLLYAAALGTSLLDIRRLLTPILGLSVGLVLFTALGVAFVASWLLPIPFAVAFALGAIVSPPDAVAATAVARRIGLPRRTTTILEGESLLNDATALVALRTSLAAAGLAVGHGVGNGAGPELPSVSLASVSWSFVVAVVGGLLIGWMVFVLVGVVRKHVHESAADTALSFIAPFLAYLPAELVGSSGVLAVVTAGLLLSHNATRLQSAASRLAERINWASVTFLLENAVFLLIGLQVAQILADLDQDSLTTGQTVGAGLVILVAVLVLRPLWLFPFAWLAGRIGDRGGAPAPNALAVTSWAGMRGVVTLAAALTLPLQTPHRPSLIMIALIVTVGTLVLQGFSLPWLARRLDVRGPDPREDALQEATVVQAATAAGLRAIEPEAATDPQAVEEIRAQATARVNRVWERLGPQGSTARETPGETYRRLRLEMIEAEREELLKIRSEHAVDHEVLANVMVQLDAEEAALSFRSARAAGLRDDVLLAPDQVSANCEHLAAEEQYAVPQTPEGCAECLHDHEAWVHLRLCVTCGHVGCCDSSPHQHATAHFRETGHPVMRSLEPGEAWRWCFVDEVLG